MTTAIVHRTPGLLDPRAFSVMGLSAKPRSDNPIGLFGTGLKYAIATLCRMGDAPVMVIGRDRYTFVGRADEFRGAKYLRIRARLEKPGWARARYIDLPFTTEYGRFWQPWMAYREIESNTRDEGGSTEVIHDWGPDHDLMQHPDSTCFIVKHPDYIAAHAFQDGIFLPGAGRDSKGVEAHTGESDKLYWRGMRVMDLTKRTVRTWNFMEPLELTEDRTLKHVHVARYHLTRWIAEHCTDERLIEDVLMADAEYWEHKLEFREWAARPTEQFIRVAERVRIPHVMPYLGKYAPTPAGSTPWERHPRPWALDDPSYPTSIVDALGVEVLARPHEHPVDWAELARLVVARINGEEGRGRTAEQLRYGLDADENIPF
jgi:hypothetical protein